MYSRSYNTPHNNVPPNYNGTSINPPEESKSENEIPYARVPLMDMPVYTPYKANKEESPPMDIPVTAPIMKKIAADDILLIGLLIILLGCENVDMKLIIAVGVLLFVGF